MNLIKITASGTTGKFPVFEDANRGDVFLSHDNIFDLAIVGTVLPARG